jgi:hypothetical protein
MTTPRKSITVLILLSTTVLFAQQNKKVFDLENNRDSLYLDKISLSSSYPNCRSEDEDSTEFNKYLKAIQSVNYQLTVFIHKKNFDFQTKDSTVVLMHKYHVNTNGEIDYCSFIARSNLSKRTVRKYEKLLEEFIKDRKVNYESSTPFSICSHSRFWSRKELRLKKRKT